MNSPSDHLLFGKLLLEKRLISAEQLDQCLRLQVAQAEAGEPHRTLGDLLMELGLIDREQLEATLSEQRRRLVLTTIGPYVLVDRLGQGGMGTVYRAQVPNTATRVALKLLPKHLAGDPNYLSRFRREAQIGVGMVHPHIVRAVDFGEYKGTYYLAMEIVEGGTLDQRLDDLGALSERSALNIARDLLDALEYAHRRGLVHRDVKPSNILFDLQGVAKLSDFGLSKASAPDPSFMLEHGRTVGTPHYMAPEQAKGQEVDGRADLYALGATLYHAVTGRPPFSASSAHGQMEAQVTQDAPPPESINPDISPACSRLIRTFMAKDRGLRPPSALAARADVERVLRGEQPATPGPRNLGIKRSTTMRGNQARTPLPAWLVPALAALVVLLAATVIWLLVR
jgi:serine/threonine protein kinase